MMIISTIIVTYNRKNLLLRCLDAVLSQSISSRYVLIINNASTDNTEESLAKKFNTDTDVCVKEKLVKLASFENINTDVFLFNKANNTGGAGGFACGMELAEKELQSNYYWMMDDDGYPSESCLEQLLKTSQKLNVDYVMPVSLDIDNHKQLSWAVRKRNGRKTTSYDELRKSWGSILDYVTPFNGILLTKDCVARVGYINKDFFIWGDEYDHYWRCRKAGYNPVTDLNAIFFHPSAKLPFVPIFGGLLNVPYVDSKLRMICLARNYTYIYRHYNQKYKIPIKWIMYGWLFIITRHGDFEGWKLYKESVKDGLKGDFTRHLKYLS